MTITPSTQPEPPEHRIPGPGVIIQGIAPSTPKAKDYLLALCAGLVLLVIAWLGFWSNHFGNGFHSDDFPAIVNNPWLPHLSSVGRFFTNPRMFSLTPDTADYRPLLSALFAIDFRFAGSADAFLFQTENFAWFTIQLLLIFQLFRLLPGGNVFSALFGAFLYGLHPVVADTVNYPLQRGAIIAASGVIAGMVLWIWWPRLLPQKLPLKLKRVPETGFDDYLRTNYQRFEARYLRLIHLPVGLYLWPVALAMLADPAAAIFAPILLVYILLFESGKRLRHAIPATVLCGGYWILHALLTFRLRGLSPLPAANYWITQPWVAMRSLFAFFAPLHLSAESDLAAFARFWSPLAIAGYVGVAALIAAAVFLGRREEWRGVAFGLWWFLLALVPWAIVPHRVVEANWAMFLPFVGLALAASQTVWIVFALLFGSGFKMAALAGVPAVLVAVLALCGWGTYHRNAVWQSEASLWSDAMVKSPRSGRAFMNFGLTRMDADPEEALGYFGKAARLSPRDPVIRITLARAYNTLSRTADAEAGFKSAVADAGSYAPARSAYAEWLRSQGRSQEAYDVAMQAIALDPYDLSARRTVMSVTADWHQWADLKRFANETLLLFPDDPDSSRALLVAQTGIDQLAVAEKLAAEQPSADHYLSLSVHYYENRRYEDCIRAAKEALKLNPDLGEAYANIASAYHTMGRMDETIAALREEVRLNPNLPSAAHNLDVMLAEKARTGK